jgi:hypothetical protein
MPNKFHNTSILGALWTALLPLKNLVGDKTKQQNQETERVASKQKGSRKKLHLKGKIATAVEQKTQCIVCGESFMEDRIQCVECKDWAY